MKHLWGIAALTAFVVVLSVGGASAYPVDDTVTVVLKSGDTLEVNRYDVQERFKVLRVWIGRSDRSIPFNAIDAIYDPDGEKITKAVLTEERHRSEPEPEPRRTQREPAPPPRESTDGDTAATIATSAGPWVSERSREWAEREESLKQSFLVLSPGLSIPAGSLFSGYSVGVGGEASLHIAIQHHFGISLTLGRTGISPETDQHRSTVEGSVWRFLLGAEYISPANFNSESPILWYFGSAIGIVNQSEDRTWVDGAGSTLSSSDSEARFAQRLYGGIVPMASENIGLHVGAGMDFVQEGQDHAYESTRVGFIFDVTIGLSFVF